MPTLKQLIPSITVEDHDAILTAVGVDYGIVLNSTSEFIDLQEVIEAAEHAAVMQYLEAYNLDLGAIEPIN